MVEGIVQATGASRDQIRFVDDRPGHDVRYAIDFGATTEELGWRPTRSVEEGLAETVRWYESNESWWGPILDGRYREWIERWYGGREAAVGPEELGS